MHATESSHRQVVAAGSDLGPGRRLALSMAGGVAISALILFGIAQAQKTRIGERPPPAADLRKTILPEPPPPPPPARVAPEPPPPEVLELTPAPSESPQKIASVLQFPALHTRPNLQPNLDFSLDSFRPDSDVEFAGADHVYQRSDVDQPAVPVYRKVPAIPRDLAESVPNPRVTFIFVVGVDGTVSEVRLLRSSGDDRFDTLVMEALKQWKFKPAVVKGRRVRMLAEQPIYVKVPSANRFSIE